MITHSTHNPHFRNPRMETAGYWIMRHRQAKARLRRTVKLGKQYRHALREMEHDNGKV